MVWVGLNYVGLGSAFNSMYNIEQREDGWAVIDEATGEVVMVNDFPQSGMTLADADDLADLLNRIERQKPTRLS